jgi:CHAD domain-containing protein
MAVAKKWIQGTQPQQPISLAARIAVRQRLGDVRWFLPRAAKRAPKDVEDIHQLRVATRRSVAALQVFADLLPQRRVRKLTRKLKRIRRAAGNARDLDVLIHRLRGRLSGQGDGDIEMAIDCLKRRRRRAQLPVVAIRKRLDQKKLGQSIRKATDKVRWRGPGSEPTFAVVARWILQPVVEDFFRAADTDLSHIERLHEMRIKGKTLRYALELLASAFENSVQHEIYPTFVQVQDRLGGINDHATAARLFHDLGVTERGSARNVFESLSAMELGHQSMAAAAFRQWWNPQRSRELHQQFEALLAQPVQEEPRPASSSKKGDNPPDRRRPASA